jgi:exodeoxyribonuclease-5
MQVQAANQVRSWYNGARNGFDKFYLAGYAGSGKTSILPYIIEHCGLHWEDVVFCAPTGKAAKVMTGKLQAMYGTNRIVAKTIHSQIYIPLKAKVEQLRDLILEEETRISGLVRAKDSVDVDPAEFQDRMKQAETRLRQLQRDFDDAQRQAQRNGPSFALNTESQVSRAKLIVVDEASMVGETITDDLFMFDVPVLAIGDPAQLPPVGDVPGLTIGDPDFFLSEIHRQAADNPIIRLSMDVREGKLLRPGTTLGDKVRIVRGRDDHWTLNPDYDAQVLCGTHKTRWILTKRIRDMCGYTSTCPEVGEPLMVCKNSRKIQSLVNGSFVECVESPGELYDGDASLRLKVRAEDGLEHYMNVYQGTFEEHFLRQRDGSTAPKYSAFDSKRSDEILDFGWVITTHKSQGSQWDNVVVHDESGRFRDDASKWLYTAVTRAADELTVVM